MDFKRFFAAALSVLFIWWCVVMIGNVIEIRKELNEIILILNGCSCDEIPQVTYEQQVYEDYVPSTESVA